MKFEFDYFILFANCIPVKGAKRSIICDLQRGVYLHIPNTFADFFEESKKMKLKDILKPYDEQDKEIIYSYIEFAEKHDLGFFTNTPENFPDIDLKFETPHLVEDIIIEYSNFIYANRIRLIQQITCVGVRFIEIRVKEKDLYNLIAFIDLLPETRVRGIILLIEADGSFIFRKDSEALLKFDIIINIVYHSVSDVKILNELRGKKLEKTVITDSVYRNENCGKIDVSTHTVSLKFYLETLVSNNCLSRKLSIDHFGQIKNCPSMKIILGNIIENSLLDILKSEKYLKYSSINKSQINVCKDCEYRMICSDCRAYLENPYEKPLKCNYDPYND